MNEFSCLPEVDIDSSGRFKYILLKATNRSTNDTKYLVRGFAWAHYHVDIYDIVANDSNVVKYECLGGGRIEVSPENKTINIFGTSLGFGQADHKITTELVQKKYPEYSVTWSNEGY